MKATGVSLVWVLIATCVGAIPAHDADTTTKEEAQEAVSIETECNTENGECANPGATVNNISVEDPNCPSREYVIRCAGIHLDANNNGKLERAELETAIDRLPWYGRSESDVV